MNEENLILSKICFEINKIDKSIFYLENHIKINKGLNFNEHEHFFKIYKKSIEISRNYYRNLDEEFKYLCLEGETEKAELILEYLNLCNNRITNTLNNGIFYLNNFLIPNTNNNEENLEYYRILGDFYRYLFECSNGKEKENYFKNYLNFYKKSFEYFNNEIDFLNPFYLSLILSYTVFISEKDICLAIDLSNNILNNINNFEILPLEIQQKIEIIKKNVNLWNK